MAACCMSARGYLFLGHSTVHVLDVLICKAVIASRMDSRCGERDGCLLVFGAADHWHGSLMLLHLTGYMWCRER